MSVKADSMSFALENKHKQSRENIEKTNNNLGKAKKPWENQKTKEPNNKKQTKTNNSQLLLAGPPLSSRLPQNCFFGVFCSFFFFGCPKVFWLFLGCYWFSPGFLFFWFSYLGQSVFLLFPSTFKVCEPKSHLKAYVLCSYNESV